jgi:hypothetical protein
MRIAIAAALLALAACGPSPTPADKESAEAKLREEMGQDDPNIPFDPQPPGPPRTYEAMSKTAMSFTPGALTLTPTAQKSENLPPGAVFAFGNGYTIETTLNPGGAMMGQNPPDWSKIFIDTTGAKIDPEQVTLYDVDNETIPKDAPNGGFCKKVGFLATYTVKSPGAEDLTIAAFEGDQWPPKDEAALCGTFTYSIVH